MNTCKDCGTEYSPASVTIPSPIPDGMCAICGTQLSDQKIVELVEKQFGKGENNDNAI